MDAEWMKEALREARLAFDEGEVPVGAVLVQEGKIIARGRNRVEAMRDPTAHAEMIALREAASLQKRWRLTGLTLYCTLEPCAMCAGAMFSARIDRLVYGAPDLRLGAHGSFVDLFREKHPMHTIEVVSGVLEEESACLMKTFFQSRRSFKVASNSNEKLCLLSPGASSPMSPTTTCCSRTISPN